VEPAWRGGMGTEGVKGKANEMERGDEWSEGR